MNYFGEEDVPETCGSCGSCTSQTDLVDITETKKIISSVYRMAEHTGGRKFGSAILTDVLRGSQKAQIKSLGFDKISTWGIMKGYKAEAIRNMVNFLTAEGFPANRGSRIPRTFFYRQDNTVSEKRHKTSDAKARGKR